MSFSEEKLHSFLLEKNIVKKAELAGYIKSAKDQRIALFDLLFEKDILSDTLFKKFVADSYQIPSVSLGDYDISDSTLQLIPERIARKYKVVAFEENSHGISIASSTLLDSHFVDMISQKAGKQAYVHFASKVDIDRALQLYKKDLQRILEKLLKQKPRKQTIQLDAPIEKIVDILLTYALREKASDIHIEPEEADLLVRFRIDSVLHDVLTLDKNLHGQIVSRIKVMSRLRTDEHLSAQDGKMRQVIDEQPIDIRVSIIPIAEGEKVVLRLLTTRFKTFAPEELGMNERYSRRVHEAVQKSYGMILSTGPTGSGKTTTIYSLLKMLNSRDKNITTIEDPIEYQMKGVNQIQVNMKTNLTFANGLRSILRQDPNVIFVGEIRDNETASIAVNAALTGHLVLSTLHTNDAATALPRLIDMKVEPFLVASTVNLIIAQRLVRTICPSCKQKKKLSRAEVVKNLSNTLVTKYFGAKKDIVIHVGKGCRLCHQTGYEGRLGIFEFLEVTEQMRKLIIQKQDSDVLEKQAIKDGMITMLEDGLAKVVEGMTTLEEVLRVAKKESDTK